jgi:hypothetical protein
MGPARQTMPPFPGEEAIPRRGSYKYSAKLSASVTGSLSQFQSDPMMNKAGSTTIVERGANENGLNVATNLLISFRR